MNQISFDSAQEMTHDPALPGLGLALDLAAMARNLNSYFRSHGMSSEWAITGCRTEKAYYRPGKRCGLLYRVCFQSNTGRQAEEWVYVQFCRPGKAFRWFQSQVTGMRPASASHDFLKAIPSASYWHEHEMIIWLFPMDPVLKSLPDVTSQEFALDHIAANLNSLWPNGSSAWVCRQATFERVKYMPRKRCVLRYDLSLEDRSGAGRTASFYSKVHKETSSRYYFDRLRSIHRQLTEQQVGLNIPYPLIYFDESNTSWHEAWDGQPLVGKLDSDSTSSSLFTDVAVFISRFHKSRLDGLRAGPDTDEVLETAVEDGTRYGQLLRHNSPLAERVLSKLKSEKNRLQPVEEVTPLHGAFRCEQMLIRDRELALLDFEALAIGDPLYDVAEFIASLEFLEFSQHGSGPGLRASADMFLQSYIEEVPWTVNRRRLAWYVLAFTMSKMYSSIKNLNIEALQGLETKGQELVDRWLAEL